jgi:hypothetical protein
MIDASGYARVAIAALLAAAVFDASASAGAQRTFVSVSGSDAGSCSVTQPCRTFAAAISNANAGGEVVVLDSGGYGPVTITKSITIVAPRGVYAGVSVFSGDGIVVDAAGIDVTLRGLSINGQGGDSGIHLLQANTLVIEDCEIAGMGQHGVSATAANTKLLVRNTVLRDNHLEGFTATGTITATLDGVAAFRNADGVSAISGARVAITGSTLASNTNGVVSGSAGAVTTMFVTRSTLSDNTYGMEVFAAAGQAASIVSDANAITFHSGAAMVFHQNGGSEIIYTRGNNAVGYYATPFIGGSPTPLNPL